MIKQFIVGLTRAILKHNLGLYASAIAFFVFSSMIPLMLLLIFGASFVIPSSAVDRFLEEILKSYIPTIPAGGMLLASTVKRLAILRSDFGLIGVIGLLWTTIGGFVSLQFVLDIILEVRKRRSFIKQYIVGFSMLGVLLGLTIISSLITAVSPSIVVKIAYNHSTAWLSVIHMIAQISFPIILFVTCCFCYRVLPSRTISNASMWIGAAVSTLCIYLSRWLFVVYTHHLGHYTLIYGTFTFVMLLSFWIYIVCIILLFGLEVAARIESNRH